MAFDVQPVVLQNQYLRLEPLAPEHAQGLFLRGQETDDWAWMPRPCFVDMHDCRHWIEEAVIDPGVQAFAYVEPVKQRVVGSSRYLNIRPEHRSLEIGWTWLGRDYQRTALNTSAKLLLIGHAIETLGAVRMKEVEEAQQVITKIIQNMESKGEVVISGRGGEEFIA